MAHHYLTRHAIITWLAIERGEGLSSAVLLDSAFDTDWFQESDETRSARDELELLDDEEIRALFELRMQYHRQRLADARNNVEAGMFFNKPGAFADYGFWARQLLWRVDDCISLSLGRNPDIFNSASIEAADPSVRRSTLAKEYYARCTIASSWMQAGQLEAESTPGEMLAWLDRTKLDYAPELARAVEEIGPQIADWKTLHDEVTEDLETLALEIQQLRESNARWEGYAVQLQHQEAEEKANLQMQIDELSSANQLLLKVSNAPSTASQPDDDEQLDPRVKTTLYSLINVMSVAKYRYNPSDSKSPVPGNIVRAVDESGLEISEKTVRTHLRLAAEIADRERQKLISKRK